jgi:hypothetical protein
MVVEVVPYRVVVVEGDRVVDPSGSDRLIDQLDLVLEGELRRVDADNDEPVVAVGPGPRPDVGHRAQPVDAGQRPEVDQEDVTAQLVRAEGLGVDPPGRPVQSRCACHDDLLPWTSVNDLWVA